MSCKKSRSSMRVFIIFLVLSIGLLVPSVLCQQAGDTSFEKGRMSILVRVGIGDKEPTKWDGEVSISPGKVAKIEGWAFERGDSAEGNRWQLSSHFLVPRFAKLLKIPPKRVVPNGVVITFSGASESSKVAIKTAEGDFGFQLSDVQYGAPQGFLKGRAQVERVPACSMAVSAPTEDDYPSAVVTGDGQICVAYIAFKHGKGFEVRKGIPEMPENFSDLNTPVGGDQLMFTSLERGRWSEPKPLTKGGEDLFKTAIAWDGEGRIWVFWSRNVDGNWDIFCMFRKGDKWSKEIQLTSQDGPDVNPAAATDSTGRVCLVWQAFRGDNSDILAMRQEGENFGKATVVAGTPDNEWDPAIAASKDGQVAVAWDTYAKGDYDVYCRICRNGEWGEPVAVAATARGEARASIAYDGEGRLWIAWEDSPERWGKDWGALEKSGVALYQGRTVGLRILAGGKLYKPVAEATGALMPPRKPRPGRPAPTVAAMPCLGADSTGRVWVGLRAKVTQFVAGVGTVWFEYLTCYEGRAWKQAILVPHTDNLLDNHPSICGMPDGNVVVIGSSDLRHRSASLKPGWRKAKRPQLSAPLWADVVNNELYIADLNVSFDSPKAPELEALPAEQPSAVGGETRSEREDIKRIREYRTKIEGKTARVWRGEFHRHTEISGDGGGDGALLDMWRYGLDAARLDWIGNGDHDNGGGREYSWWITQKTTDVFHVAGAFTPMFSYERSCGYPDGHRNAVFAARGVRTLPRLARGAGKAMDDQPDATPPHSPDTIMLYKYLRSFDGICASHTSGTDMGTDWRDNDSVVEPVVEIYQGCRQSYERPDAPRSNAEDFSIGGWRPLGFVSRALLKGYRLGFQSSSDHVSTHISYCNVWVEEPTREQILECMKRRHVYGATDNIIADVHCNGHFMGDEFETKELPTFDVKLIGTKPFAKVDVIKDNEYVYSPTPNKADVSFRWTDKVPKAGATSYYYIRGEQEDGELVWVSPMWIKYVGK